jgi:hypothetical protein
MMVGNPEEPAVDIVSAAIMAKVLEERERERSLQQHCETCRCISGCGRDAATQTADHVSVAVLPANHSNILLDNMYRASPLSTSSCRSAVLVHSPRGRLNSNSSDCDSHPLGDHSETETDI